MTLVGYARRLAFLVSVVVAIAACGEGSNPETPQKATGLRKKIAAPQTDTAPEKAVRKDKAIRPNQRAQAAQKPAAGVAGLDLPEKRDLIEPEKSEGLKLAEGLGGKKGSFYDPTGKIDPFESPFQTQTQNMAAQEEETKERQIPVTPLQRISLGQLKLVAVILASSGNKALVEDPSGKGYIVSRGTYIGQYFGRIKRILKDRIVVEEEVEDFVSRSMKKRTRELKLHKKVGDV
jgi:type IV pilus assembly protein PilP